MYSASASAALNSGLPDRAMTVSKPDGASSRAMSIALSGLSVSRIFGAIGSPPGRLLGAEDSRADLRLANSSPCPQTVP